MILISGYTGDFKERYAAGTCRKQTGDLPLAAMSATTMLAQVVIAAGGLVVETVSASAPFVHRLRVI